MTGVSLYLLLGLVFWLGLSIGQGEYDVMDLFVQLVLWPITVVAAIMRTEF